MDKIIRLTDEQFHKWNLNFKEYLTLEEAAEYLGISERHVKKLVIEGKIPAEVKTNKAYYFKKSELINL